MWKLGWSFWRFSIVVIWLGIGIVSAGAAELIVSDARIGVQPTFTRFVLETSGRFDYHVFTLAEPYRVVVDLPEIEWRVAPADAVTASSAMGVISNFRYGLFQTGISRVVIDLAQPVIVTNHFFLSPLNNEPHRFVLDLKVVSSEKFNPKATNIITAGWNEVRSAALRIAAPLPSQQVRKTNRRVVVIDPGHGGVDPGAVGVTGTYEKLVTLSAAKTLKHVMEKTGRYDVILTRGRDVFLRLRDRFKIAHQMNASLFLSIHADASRKRSTRGASIYTLSEKASDSEAGALATKENRADIIAGADLSDYAADVSDILIDLAQRVTNNESWQFAEILVEALKEEKIKILRNSHRSAGFAVLKSPNVPSLLIELGYLSNRRDEKLLRSASYQEKFARAILHASDRYFDRLSAEE